MGWDRRGSTTGVLVGPGDDLAVDGGSDHVADGTLVVGPLVQVLVAVVAARVDAGLHFALIAAFWGGGGTGAVEGELLQVEWAAEMPGDLFFVCILLVVCLEFRYIYICSPRFFEK